MDLQLRNKISKEAQGNPYEVEKIRIRESLNGGSNREAPECTFEGVARGGIYGVGALWMNVWENWMRS